MDSRRTATVRWIDRLWCDIHNMIWGAYGSYRAYRTVAYVPHNRRQAIRAAWRNREFWD